LNLRCATPLRANFAFILALVGKFIRVSPQFATTVCRTFVDVQSMHSASRRGQRIRFVLSLRRLASVFLLTALAASQPSVAREPDRALAPLLQSAKPLAIGVVGDSIAGDLANGLRKLLNSGSNVTVVKFTKPATGLMRDDVYDWDRALESFLRQKKLDVVAVMIGGNDRQSIWKDGDRLTHGSRAWQAEYESRLARFMAVLKKEKAKVFWIGLPVVRSGEMSRDYREINAIQRAQAQKFGFTYVSVWDAFADAKGGYTSFGHSLQGVKRRLRKNDGMHFTVDGELLLAHTVASAIGRGLDTSEPAN
jgi:uncharacterized protein